MKQQSGKIAKGAVILAISGLLVKVLGMIYKIPLTNLLGDSGMGYFNTAYTVYSIFFVLSGTGLPTALSLSVAKDLSLGQDALAEKRFLAMRRFTLVFGAILMLCLMVFAGPIAALLGNENAFWALIAVSPAVFFVTASAAHRGYFQGQGNMLPTALSQLVEALFKLLLGLLLLLVAIRLRVALHGKAAYAIFGLTLATVLVFLLLSLFVKKRQTVKCERTEALMLMKETLRDAFPITLSSLCLSLASSLDLLLLMRSLQAIGYTPEMANAAWGNYSSMVLPLFHMPQVLLTPIAYATLPALRSHVARGDVREAEQLMKSALTVTAIVSALAALGLSLFSYDALQLLYTDQDAVARAYPKLALVSLAIFPLGLVTTASTLLQAFGKLWTPTVAFAIGACVKIFVTLALTEMLGESVSPWGTLLSYTVTAALDLALLSQKLPLALSAVTLKPFFVAGVSVLGAVFVRAVLTQASLSARLVSVLSIGVAALLALGLAVLTRAIKEEDLLVFGIAVKPRRKKQ